MKANRKDNVYKYQLIVSSLSILFSLVFMLWVSKNVIEQYEILISIIGGFAILSILEKFIPKIFTRTTIHFILLFLFVGLITSMGNSFTRRAHNIETSLNQNYGNYLFDLSLDSKSNNDQISVAELLLSYDFSVNKGNLSFEISEHNFGSNLIRNIRFVYPKEIVVTDVKVEGQKYDENYNYTVYLREDPQHSFIEMHDFNITRNLTTIKFLVNLQYSKHIEPKGKFLLKSNFWRVFNMRDKTIEFSLGDYACKFPCHDTDPLFSIIKIEGQKLNVYMTPDYYKSGGSRVFQQEFTLNMVNEKLARDAQDNKNIGFGLIVAGLVIYIEAFAQLLVSVIRKPAKEN